jgi:3-hydroxyisobutyrate dehydrogenase-like beta-hydroxyacid dehydrogenase
MDILAQQTFLIGTDCAHASLVKLLGNAITATALEALAEVIALIRKSGLDPKPFVDILTNTMFGGRAHRVYGEQIVAERYTPGFAFPSALNDVQLALAEAEKASVPMPTVNVVRDRLVAGIARGHAHRDWSALGLVAMEEARLSIEAAALADAKIDL